MASSMLFAFLVCLLGALALLPPSHGSCFETERMALLSIKAGIQSSNHSWLSSWTGHDCCQWRGVACNNESGYVIKLDLHYPYPIDYDGYTYFNMQPPSKLNSSLLHLRHLKHLDLSMNNFNDSPIPDFIGSLANLEYLNLSYAQFSGAIPHTLGNLSSLRFLDLRFLDLSFLELQYSPLFSDNLHWLSGLTSLQHLDLSNVYLSEVSGWLHDINMLPSLRVLKLSNAQLQGGIHDINMQPPSKLNSSLLHLRHLKHLDLSMNNFDDSPIPVFIGSLANLEYLNLSNARFSGAIPHTLGNLSSLRFLDLQYSRKMFDDSDLFCDNLHWLSGLTSLQHLDLSYVDLSEVSGWLHDINMLPSLRVLKLSNALLQFGGVHAATLAHLNFTSLRVLDLSYNFQINPLSPLSLPPWLFNLSGLVHLDLSFCVLYGNLPVTIGNLGSLESLVLSGNRLNGSIPETLNNLTKLVTLDLSSNDIGRLPKRIGRLQKLVKLDLAENKVHGWIPESIGGLRNLQYLDLSGNMISGEIPEAFGNLTLLQYFDASGGNILSGKLPESIGDLKQLQNLIMPGNGIVGQLPESMGKLSSLMELDLSWNNISGTLPKTMGNLCSLQHLYLTNNFISGPIDDLLNGLSECFQNKESYGLSELYLGGNRLNGTVPESLGRLYKMRWLDLHANSLTGTLTELHFANLTDLRFMDFSFNMLQLNVTEDWVPPFNATGIIMCSCRIGPAFPAWIVTQTQLTDLCLSDARISGHIPAGFWDLSDLKSLNLAHNSLSGALPTSFGHWHLYTVDLSSNKFEGCIPEFDPSNLRSIDLSNNSFSGPIPSSFASATYIQIFSFSHNNINGSIPLLFCNLTSLMVLDLSDNDMIGRLPHCWNQWPSLAILDLSDNNFFGGIPDSIVSLPNLQSLHLRNNAFSGNLPSSLKKANRLVALDIGENKLSGRIPAYFGENLLSLAILRLSSNLLEGVIPEQLSKLSSLRVLDLAHNKLSGIIPHSFGGFKAMATSQSKRYVPSISEYDQVRLPANYSLNYNYLESLLINAKGRQTEYTKVLLLVTSIDLSSNRLSGEFPQELSKLHGLRFLNLSDNLFNGKIPENIGDMNQLESLDLSMNSLSGTIPPSISTLNFLSHLNLSHNRLSGKIPSGNQLQTLNASAYYWNDGLCGYPLADCTTEPPSQALLHGGNQEGNEDWFENLCLYIGLASGFIVGFWVFLFSVMIKKSRRISYFRTIDKVYDWIYVKLVIYSRRLKSILPRRN